MISRRWERVSKKGKIPRSTYGKRLWEKQKVRRRYGMRERQFRRFFDYALKQDEEPTGVALLQLLELRLDNVVFRLGLAKTRPQARQFISHGNILVDGKEVTIPSYLLKVGQAVTLRPEFFENPLVQENLKLVESIPEWLEVKDTYGYIVRKPRREEMDADLDEDQVVAFYSR